MRNTFAATVITQCNTEAHFFLTGDLGFMALEHVQTAFKHRFINMGVAEQNMTSVAAGIAKEGFKVFTYSIAPFCYARPFEQIRNDICFGKLPVCVVGNGGGYAYGYMGPTHHALEDCATMTALGMRVLVPAFNEDISAMLSDLEVPTYLRLGYDEHPKGLQVPKYASWREVLVGGQGILVALGPLAGTAWKALNDLPIKQRPSVWAVTEMDLQLIPEIFWDALVKCPMLYVIEEHVAEGGLGMNLSLAILQKGYRVQKFVHRFALRYPSGRFGSQTFHRRESGLDSESILIMIKES